MKKLDLEEGLKYVLLTKRTEKKSKWTIRDYETVINEFIKFMGNVFVEDITKQDVMEFIRFKLDTGVSDSTVNIRIRYLRAFFNVIIVDRLVNEKFQNPMTNFPLFKEDESYNKEIPIKAINKLLDTINLDSFTGRRNYVMLLVMLSTGIRPSEIVYLEDRDWKDSHLIVRDTVAKSRKMRLLPISSGVEKEMYKYLAEKQDWGGNILFPNYEGEFLTNHALGLWLRRLSRKAGIRDGVVFPYAFRHTFAINYLRRGGDVFKLQRILGHKTLEMTKRYVVWNIEDLYEDLDSVLVIDEVLNREKKTRRRR